MQSKTPLLSIYKASAGAGKTYILTKRYIELALKRPNYFKKILALTFTNKASLEMKQRILDALKTNREEYLHPILEHIRMEQNWSKQLIGEKAQACLTSILHHYYYFQVGTIDQFFNSILASFSRELGFSAPMNLELELSLVLDQIIEQCYKDARKDKRLVNWLTQFIHYKMDMGKSWQLDQALKQFGFELLKEEVKQNFSKNNQQYQPKSIKDFMVFIEKVIGEFEQTVQQYAKQAVDQMKNHGYCVDDFKYGKSGPAHFFEKMFHTIEPPGIRARQALDGASHWIKKENKDDTAIMNFVENILIPILEHIIHQFDEHYPNYLGAVLIKKNIFALGLSDYFDSRLKAYRQKQNVILISDLSYIIKQITSTSDAPFIYEKVGNKFDHFLIDEFQDTSDFQWANLKPLLLNSLGEGRQSAIVGDVKQSIYRWRGADASLLNHTLQTELHRDYWEEIRLQTNWRSHPDLIAFNNYLFDQAPKILLNELTSQLDLTEHSMSPNIQSVLQQIIQTYEENEQTAASKRKDQALIQFEFLLNQGAESWKEQAVEKLWEQIKEFIHLGYQPSDIAILVRTHHEGRQIIELLEEHILGTTYAIHFNSEESKNITGSVAVQLIVFGLTWILEEPTQLHWANLVFYYQFYILENTEITFKEISECYDREAPSYKLLPINFSEIAQQYSKDLILLTEELISCFNLNALSDELININCFQDIVLTFCKKNMGGGHDFIEYWGKHKEKFNLPITDDHMAITISTVHKAKGLEYPIVCIPYCEWSLDHIAQSPPYLWCDTSQTHFRQINPVPLNYQKKINESPFQANYVAEKIKIYLDNLNLLYVACTRAKIAMLAYSPLPTGRTFHQISSLLYALLSQSIASDLSSKSASFMSTNKYWNQEDHIFKYGKLSKKFMEKAPNKRDTIEVVSHEIDESQGSNAMLKLTYQSRDIAKNWGIYLHTFMEKVHYLDQFEPLIKQEKARNRLTKNQADKLLAIYEELHANAYTRNWFSKRYEVRNECPIYTSTGEIRRPDRVLIREGQAIVIDFKSGIQLDSASKQMQEYGQLLDDLGFESILLFILYLEPFKLVEVPLQQNINSSII